MIMHYKSYVGYVTHNKEAGYYYGEVLGLDCGINFFGDTLEEAEQALKESIEAYFEFCAQDGIEPEKTFSGKLNILLKHDIHKKLSLEAARKGKSINELIHESLSQTLEPVEEEIKLTKEMHDN